VNRSAWFFCFLILGIGVGTTNLFAPLHEYYHAGVASNRGISATVTSWSTTELKELDPVVLVAGWTSELWWAVLIAVVACGIGRITPKLKWLTGGAAIGYAGATFVRAFGSTDFNSLMYKYVSLNVEADLLPQAWAAIHGDIETRWAIVGSALISIALFFIILSLVKKPKYERRPA
jgi:hypothetical protein